MRRALALALVFGVVGTTTAQAATVRDFRVTETEDGLKIAWAVTVCAKPGLKVFLRPRIDTDDHPPELRGRFGGPQPRRCTRWRTKWPNNWGEDTHFGRIRVSIPARDFVRYTPWQTFHTGPY